MYGDINDLQVQARFIQYDKENDVIEWWCPHCGYRNEELYEITGELPIDHSLSEEFCEGCGACAIVKEDENLALWDNLLDD